MRRRALTAGTSQKRMNLENYLTIEALANGMTVKLNTADCEYCIDGSGTWIPLAGGSASPSLLKAQKISFRGNIKPSSSNGSGTFSISQKCKVSGNALSLLYGDDAIIQTTAPSYAFKGLFKDVTNLTDAKDLILSATQLKANCYEEMFYGTNIVNAPVLPALRLSNNAEYRRMFYKCSAIRYIKAMFTTNISDYYTSTAGWLHYAANRTDCVFVKNKKATWTLRGINGIPSNWTIETADS